MSLLSTDDAPYTARYVQELLGIDESALNTLTQSLQLAPKTDPYTQAPSFNEQDLTLLRQAVELGRRGESLPAIIQQLKPSAISPGEAAVQQRMAQGGLATTGNQAPAPREESFALLVETISSSKELILQEMSRLLDDRLSGLDEVVVELIRCKSENDSLRQKLSQAIREKESLQEELGKFRPVQFGFYKKVK